MLPFARFASQSAPQRLSLRIVTLTFGASGMSAHAAGFLPEAPLQMAFMKSVGFLPPSYLFPATKIVGLPLAPFSCERLKDARRSSFPSGPSAHAVILSAGAPTLAAQDAPLVATSLLFSFWQRMKSNAFAGAYFAAHTWRRSPFTSLGPCMELGSPPWTWPMYSTWRSRSPPNLATTSLKAFSA
jgi:hypothetical protein